MNRPHQSLFGELVFGVVNLQRADNHDDSPALLPLANKRLDIEFGDRARLARIPQGLGGRAELSHRGRSLSGPPHGGGLVTKASEHVANDLATLVSGQMKHVRDLQVAQSLHQAGKQKHADDKHYRHQDRGQQRHSAGCTPIDPGDREQCIDEGRGEGPERMKEHARAAVYSILNIYMIKMACGFMITTSTVAIYTGFAPRWLAVLGYVLSLLLLFGSYYIRWSFVVFPLWVFLVSLCILVDNLRRPTEIGEDSR
jgi:hypothetical protein